MAKYIKIEQVCPFLGGKPCLNDGLNRDVLMYGSTAHPCFFWDDNPYITDNEEPCLIMRAVKKTLGITERDNDYSNIEIEVPFDHGKKGAENNGRKKTQI